MEFPLDGAAQAPAAFTILSLGFFLGLKHALDADHLVAISTIVSERKGLFSSSVVGVLWGIGHTAALLIVGWIVLALNLHIPDKLALALEFLVALMIIGLGSKVLWNLYRGGTVHMHAHSHDGHIHVHPHVHSVEQVHEHGREEAHSHNTFSKIWWGNAVVRGIVNGKRSVFIGLMHGMAGSAAVMLVVLATIKSTALGMMYIAVFGAGSIAGMLIMSMLISVPFVVTATRLHRLNAVVRGVSGVVSVAFGIFLAWEIGITEGLFF
ncbi:MAG: urease accessory protein UreH [Bacteroidota bacterium]